MKYTLRYLSRGKFFYPNNVGAYADLTGPNVSGSYMVMHMTDRLSQAALFDTAEKAEEISHMDIDEYDPRGEFFDLLGVMRIGDKKLFEIRLKDK